MKICVCVKQVPASNETHLDPVTGVILRDGKDAILNPFDAYAVEEALRIQARYGGTITALSMGIPATEKILRRVIAVGADEAMLLTDRAFAGADTLATARTLAAAIQRSGSYDLILCGRMATDGDTAQVGPMLAEFLNIPHVSDVAAIESMDTKSLTVRRLTDDGYVRVCVSRPALITVLKEINVPRLPSISGVLRGEAAHVNILGRKDLALSEEEVGLKGSATRVVKSEHPVRDQKAIYLTGTVEDMACNLMSRLRQEHLISDNAHAGKSVTEERSND